jgi:hypothetical protein
MQPSPDETFTGETFNDLALSSSDFFGQVETGKVHGVDVPFIRFAI